jgi:hypothetical protein
VLLPATYGVLRISTTGSVMSSPSPLKRLETDYHHRFARISPKLTMLQVDNKMHRFRHLIRNGCETWCEHDAEGKLKQHCSGCETNITKLAVELFGESEGWSGESAGGYPRFPHGLEMGRARDGYSWVEAALISWKWLTHSGERSLDRSGSPRHSWLVFVRRGDMSDIGDMIAHGIMVGMIWVGVICFGAGALVVWGLPKLWHLIKPWLHTITG